ncbi:MAG: hypothetical protein A3J24_11250, partial [Deltaproteobacteria bacterium RIFCSPLOWO2_02_FULL_53_8]
MVEGMSQRMEGWWQEIDVLSRLSRAVFQGVSRSYTQFFVVCCLLSAACFLMSSLGCAGELIDPTRPPAIITIPATAIAGGPPSGLQSIIISKKRRAAIIDGETVELRGKHGDATLIEVSETGVVLQGAQGRQVLTLFPDVKIMQKESQVSPKLSEKEGE